MNDKDIIAAIQDGLPVCEKPYLAIAESLGISEELLFQHLNRLQTEGKIKRFGVVVRHHELGYKANAMVVWNVPDELVDRLGQRLGQVSSITLCYRRPRRLPLWPYNLFTMIHGRSREQVLQQLEEIKVSLGIENIPCEALFSLRRFKQRGAHYINQQVKADLQANG